MITVGRAAAAGGGGGPPKGQRQQRQGWLRAEATHRALTAEERAELVYRKPERLRILTTEIREKRARHAERKAAETRRHVLANRIGSAWRQRCNRHARARRRGALRLQANYRGWRARTLLKRDLAARVLQRGFRAHYRELGRVRGELIMSAVLFCQRRWVAKQKRRADIRYVLAHAVVDAVYARQRRLARSVRLARKAADARAAARKKAAAEAARKQTEQEAREAAEAAARAEGRRREQATWRCVAANAAAEGLRRRAAALQYQYAVQSVRKHMLRKLARRRVMRSVAGMAEARVKREAGAVAVRCPGEPVALICLLGHQLHLCFAD
eukprot:SAG22_NODE_493_length_9820_cov_53.085588_2_plen_327_part_00